MPHETRTDLTGRGVRGSPATSVSGATVFWGGFGYSALPRTAPWLGGHSHQARTIGLIFPHLAGGVRADFLAMYRALVEMSRANSPTHRRFGVISKIPYFARLRLSGVDNVADADKLSRFSVWATAYSSNARFAPSTAIRIWVSAHGVVEFCYNGTNRATLEACAAADRDDWRATAGDNSITRDPQRGRLRPAAPYAYLFLTAILFPRNFLFEGDLLYVMASALLLTDSGEWPPPWGPPLGGRPFAVDETGENA